MSATPIATWSARVELVERVQSDEGERDCQHGHGHAEEGDADLGPMLRCCAALMKVEQREAPTDPHVDEDRNPVGASTLSGMRWASLDRPARSVGTATAVVV